MIYTNTAHSPLRSVKKTNLCDLYVYLFLPSRFSH